MPSEVSARTCHFSNRYLGAGIRCLPIMSSGRKDNVSGKTLPAIDGVITHNILLLLNIVTAFVRQILGRRLTSIYASILKQDLEPVMRPAR